MKGWVVKEDCHKCSTLSSGLEVGYLKGRVYHSMFVIGGSQFCIDHSWKFSNDNEVNKLDEFIVTLPHKDKVKVLNAINKYYNFCRRNPL